ncbi:MAG: hypothetical protein KDD33_11075 [Bdellovibrionales bacterium]|nr:hypothetical protein [Bdellovibrionales bacterium]
MKTIVTLLALSIFIFAAKTPDVSFTNGKQLSQTKAQFTDLQEGDDDPTPPVEDEPPTEDPEEDPEF